MPNAIGIGISPIFTAMLGEHIGLLDDIPDLTAIFDPGQQMLTNYSDPLVQLRRDTDDSLQTFSPLNGFLDWGAVTDFANGGNVFVRTLYNQTGGNVAFQGTNGQQPQLTLGAEGKPVMNFVGSESLVYTPASALTQSYTIYTVHKLLGGLNNNAYYSLFGNSTDQNYFVKHGGLTPDAFLMWGGGAVFSPNGATSNLTIASVQYNTTSSTFWFNAVQQAVLGNVGTQNFGFNFIIGDTNASPEWVGNINTVLIAKPHHGTLNRVATQNVLNSYWEVY